MLKETKVKLDSFDKEKLQKQYILERMEKYLMRLEVDELHELYLDVKDKAIKNDSL